ncbi:MAG: ribbon-helix-helix protein, CopG family [Microthrixaceae bacterium]
MTMLSFRVDDRDAAEVRRWADALGVDRSELLREALRRHLDRLSSEGDADRWITSPLDDAERSLAEIADRDFAGVGGLLMRLRGCAKAAGLSRTEQSCPKHP